MSNDIVHIVLTLCDPNGTYSRHVAVTMASIITNTKDSIVFYILHDDSLTEYNRNMLKKMSVPARVQISFIDVEGMYKAAALKISKRNINISRAMYYRLFIQDVINCPKIIYLDCDIVVELDIAELWKIDIGNAAVAAVRDVETYNFIKTGKMSWRSKMIYKIMGIDVSKYFNGGVLIMNLDKIRTNYSFANEVIRFYSKYGNITTYGNQDCLNYVFANDCELLDEKYNNMRDTGASINHNNIWHMAGDVKPWNVYTRLGVDDLYWRYLLETPYISDVNSLIHAMLIDLSSLKYTHLHSEDCMRRLKKQLADNIFRGHIFTVPRILFLLCASLFKK